MEKEIGDMSEQVFKKVCLCEACGNEAEMTITCSLDDEKDLSSASMNAKPPSGKEKVPGHMVCSHCGAEADMWLDM